MGAFATDVRTRLRDGLAERLPSPDWQTEYALAGTPVDVVEVGATDSFESVTYRPLVALVEYVAKTSREP
ncbi:hypothetical protein KTS45_15970 [Halomicroarcula limicola]|uniref:Uncharacterized protein n=1 Tax=Haloarcula limicola TaxID=1429915 RepID=A0A8J7YED3_9EURY|nr:hypothetical protein [Halomicroarcula limicola]MBV0925701.1 hypothetical protein [Halomicroarcula limicola]